VTGNRFLSHTLSFYQAPPALPAFDKEATMSAQRRQPLGQRVHDWLAEPEDQQFTIGKWRFWFIAVAALSVINSIVTWLIFRDDSENYSGPIMISAGALVAWLCVAALHYSDSPNRKLSSLVSVVDSVALLFVMLHFAGLVYVYGHYRTLRSDEARYEAAAEKFNVEAKQVSADNVKIAEAAQTIAKETTKAEKLRNDTAYQTRKAAEAGARLPGQRAAASSGIGAGLNTSVIELEKPARPAESSAAFLTKWDWAVRAANLGELLLAGLTLILVRILTSRSNTFVPAPRRDGYTDAYGGPSGRTRPRLGFAEAQDRPPDTRPKAPRNWI